MAHFKFNQKKKEDKIVYGNGIVDGIVLLAVSELQYVKLNTISSHKKEKSSSIEVKFDKDGVRVNIDVKIHFTQNVSDTAFKIQETIRHNIESMTDYHLSSVNVNVKGVFFDEIVTTKPNIEHIEITEKEVKVENSEKVETTTK